MNDFHMNPKASIAQTGRPRRAFHVMVKPVGSLCNLDCAYCYYLPKKDLLADKTAEPISDAILEEFIRQYISSQEAKSIHFSWHGGEPTLLGIDFFQKVVRLQQKYAGGKWIDNEGAKGEQKGTFYFSGPGAGPDFSCYLEQRLKRLSGDVGGQRRKRSSRAQLRFARHGDCTRKENSRHRA